MIRDDMVNIAFCLLQLGEMVGLQYSFNTRKAKREAIENDLYS